METNQQDLQRAAQERFHEQYRIIGRKIAYYRRLKGYTQIRLAAEMGVSSNYLSQIECGKRKKYSLHTLMLAADALKVPLKDLCD